MLGIMAIRSDIVVLALIISVIAITLVEGTCKAGWTSYRSSCYLFVHPPKENNEAQRHCASRASYLAKINSRDEKQFIINALNTKVSSADFWLGASYQNKFMSRHDGKGNCLAIGIVRLQNKDFLYRNCNVKSFFICESNFTVPKPDHTPLVVDVHNQPTTIFASMIQPFSTSKHEVVSTYPHLSPTVLPVTEFLIPPNTMSPSTTVLLTNAKTMPMETMLLASLTVPLPTMPSTSSLPFTNRTTLTTPISHLPLANATKPSIDISASYVDAAFLDLSANSYRNINDTCVTSCLAMCNKSAALRDDTIKLAKERFKYLKIDKKTTSKHRRALISAGDDRFSSAVIGYTAVAVIATYCLLISIFDLSTLYGHFR